MIVIAAGVADKQPVQVAPHHRAAQAPVAPEGSGVAELHLDHRSALPGAERTRQPLGQRRRIGDARRHDGRHGDDRVPGLEICAVRRHPDAAGAMLDCCHRRAREQPRAELARQSSASECMVSPRKYCSSETSLVMRRSLSIRCHSGRRRWPGTTGLRSSSGTRLSHRRGHPAGPAMRQRSGRRSPDRPARWHPSARGSPPSPRRADASRPAAGWAAR